MSLVYLAYEVCIKGDDRAVIICASSKEALSLDKYAEELIYSFEDTTPSDLISKIEGEIKRDLPHLLPSKIVDHSKKHNYKQMRFELNEESETQLSNSYREFVLSHSGDKSK